MKGVLAGVILVAVSAGSWFAWMAWDRQPVVGGPGYVYLSIEAWQVVGSALTVCIAVVAAAKYLLPWVIAWLAALSYAGTFGSSVVPSDETGQSGVGVLVVFIGVWVASCALAALSNGFWLYVHQRSTEESSALPRSRDFPEELEDTPLHRAASFMPWILLAVCASFLLGYLSMSVSGWLSIVAEILAVASIGGFVFAAVRKLALLLR